jgi:hypothetical protein
MSVKYEDWGRGIRMPIEPTKPSWFREVEERLWTYEGKEYYLTAPHYDELLKYLDDLYEYYEVMGWRRPKLPNSIPAFRTPRGEVVFKQEGQR